MNSVERGKWKFVISTSTAREPVTGQNEQRRLAAEWRDRAVIAHRALEQAQACGADGHDPFTRRPRFIDGARGSGGDFASFGMHSMSRDVIGSHGQERPPAPT